MLAKLWKKVLLAACIIACIFNIMSKLVNRHSLRENLESANDGETVFSIFQKDDVKVSESEEIIEGVMNPEPAVENTTNTVEDSNTTVVLENKNETVSNEEVTTEDEVVEEPKEEVKEKDDKSFSFSDFTIIF